MGYLCGYGFEEPSGSIAIDSSGQGNDGTLSQVTRVTGYYGQGLEFSSANSSGVFFLPGFRLDGADSITLMAWIYRSGASGDPRIISWAGSTGHTDHHDVMFAYSNPLGKVWARLRQSNSVTNFVADNFTLPMSTWVHAAMVWDGGNVRFFSGASETDALGASSAPLTAGRYDGAVGRNGVSSGVNAWDGLIDEVRVFDSALAQPEIENLMNTPVVGAPAVGPPKGTLGLLGAGV